jgi:FtsP/CotA-like multicopper oxidase with cupredoxin domain
MQIEDHNFTIIATEVSYVKPQEVGTLHLMSGERFDFVIDTKNKKPRDYFIRFKQLNPCYQNLQGFAILRYHSKGSRGLKYNLEFNNRTVPSFHQEYPNGTVSEVLKLV